MLKSRPRLERRRSDYYSSAIITVCNLYREKFKMSLKQQTISGAIWSLVQRWGARLWGMLVFFLLARLLGPETFGLVAYAGVFIAVADVFLNQGFVKAIVQREDLKSEHLSTAFWANIVIGFALTALVFLASPTIARLAEEPELSAILRWLSLSFVISSFANVQDAQLQRSFEYRKLAVRTMTGLVVGGVVGIVMAFMGFGVWSLVAQQIISIAISTVMLWILSPWKPALFFSVSHFQELFAFEANDLGSRALNLVNRRSDDLLIGYFLGSVALGFYSTAYKLYYIVAELFSSAVTSVSFSAISRTQGDLAKTRKAFYSLVEIVSLAAFPAFAGLALVAPILVPFALGEEWLPSVGVLQILCAVGALQAVSIFNFTVVSGLGHPRWQFLYSLVSAVINVVAFLSVVRFGIIAVAAAYTIRAYLLTPASLYAVKKFAHISYRAYFKTFLGPLLATLIMSGAVFGLLQLSQDALPLLRLILSIGGGALAYALALKFVAPDLFDKMFGLLRSTLASRKPAKAS